MRTPGRRPTARRRPAGLRRRRVLRGCRALRRPSWPHLPGGRCPRRVRLGWPMVAPESRPAPGLGRQQAGSASGAAGRCRSGAEWVPGRAAGRRAGCRTWSATRCTSARMWLEKMTVQRFRRLATSESTSARPAGSRAEVGSSRISSRGSPTRAQASPSRWVMPLENPPTRLPAQSPRPAVRSAASTAASSRPAAAKDRARSTTSKAVSQPSNSGTSGQTATWRRGTATSTVPRSAWRMPVMMDSSVVFPAPLGPARPYTQPRGTRKSTSNRPVPP